MVIFIYKKKYKSKSINKEAFDTKSYLVNDLPDAKNAANILANLMKLLEYLVKKIILDYTKNKSTRSSKDNKFIKYVKIINDRLPNVKISENPTDSQYTSYSINKGEELVFCIRDKKKYEIHDINELLYVAIHEIAHIGCPEIGHTDLFKEINKYLLEKAVCYKIYKYIDYFEDNHNYCGMTLTSTILDKNNIKCQI
jgi:hypothetical protein